MKKVSFKERMTSKRGSVLFIVLVIMSFMLVLASAVYFAVQNGRQSVVMDYSDSQAFQTANDVLNAIDRYFVLLKPVTGSNVENLNSAIANLRTNCGLWSSTANKDCLVDACGMLMPNGLTSTNQCGAAIWKANPSHTIDSLIASGGGSGSGAYTQGLHYIRTTVPSSLPGGGNVDVLIFVNKHGEIVMEVTVEYNGRRVTVSRFYTAGDQRQFAPKWMNPSVDEGRGLHWEWVNSRFPRPMIPDGSGNEIVDPSYQQVLQSSFLFNKCWIPTDPKNGRDANFGYAKQRSNGNIRPASAEICRSTTWCVNPGAAVCPGVTVGGVTYNYCFDAPNNRYPNNHGDTFPCPTTGATACKAGCSGTKAAATNLRGSFRGGCHPVDWAACHIGDGWWVWTRADANPVATCQGTPGACAVSAKREGPAPNCTHTEPLLVGGVRPPWADVRWDYTCLDKVPSGTCKCAVTPTNNRWRVGRVPGWPVGTTPPTIPTDIDVPCTGVDVTVFGVFVPKCGVCFLCDPDGDEIPPGPMERGADGTYTMNVPGVTFYGPDGQPAQWRINDAFQITGENGNRAGSITVFNSRRTDAPSHADTMWTVVGSGAIPGGTASNQHGQLRGDITASAGFGLGRTYDAWLADKTNTARQLGGLVLGYENIGDSGGPKIDIVSGGDLHLFNISTAANTHSNAPRNFPNFPSLSVGDGSINNADVYVYGDLHVHRSDQTYLASSVRYFVLGDLIFHSTGNGASSLMYVKGEVRHIDGQVARRATSQIPGATETNFNAVTGWRTGGFNSTQWRDLVNNNLIPANTTSKVQTLTDSQLIVDKDGKVLTVLEKIQRKLTQVPNNLRWGFPNNFPPTAAGRQKAVGWGASNSTDDWSGTNTGNLATDTHPLVKYDVNVNADARSRIYYINDDAVITSTGAGAADNRTHFVIIDTGLKNCKNSAGHTTQQRLDCSVCDSERLINLELRGFRGTGNSVFQWTNGNTNTNRNFMVMPIGDGTVAFNIPNGVIYQAGNGHGANLYVGPFNLGVRGDTRNVSWATNTNYDSMTRESRGGNSTFFTSLLVPDGTGRIRDIEICYVKTGTGRCNMGPNGTAIANCNEVDRNRVCPGRRPLLETEVPRRNHLNPLNMHIYLVNNNSGYEGFILRDTSLHVATMYSPRMSFRYQSRGMDFTIWFGAFFVAEFQVSTADYLVACLPGGGLGRPNPPRTITIQTPVDPNPPGFGDPKVDGSGAGEGDFNDLEGVGGDDGIGRR